MNAKTRFLTGGLASVAIASAITLAAPTTASADEPTRPCGLPATPAVYTSLIHEPVLLEVPAVTHDEWRWEREVTTFEHEYSKVVAAAYSESDWTREIPGTPEYQWSRTVVDQAAVPAVPGTPEQGHYETVVVKPAVVVTELEYVQHKTGNVQWHEAGWNAANIDDQGWSLTGNSRVVTVKEAVTKQEWVVDQEATEGTPAVEEVSHTETTWATTSPGAEWTGPVDTRTVGGGSESTTTTGDDVPSGAGWTKQATREYDAVVDTLWALEAPDGYTPTGNSQVHGTTVEQTDETSATAPADGWSKVADSLVVVVDQAAGTELIPGHTEEVLIVPAMPATEPCVEAPTDEEPTTGTAGPQVEVAAGGSGNQAEESTSVASAAGAASATVLPATGNPLSPLLATAGLGALLAGGVLVRVGRRRQTS